MMGLKIGLTGRMASGKGEVLKMLELKGFKKISLSDMVRAEVRRRGREVTRAEMQDIGNGLRKDGGAGILGKLVKETIEGEEGMNPGSDISWVIDGIRNPEEIGFLRKLPGFHLLGVEAEEEILIDRIKNRGRDTDRVSDSEIRSVLKREWGIGEPPEGQQVGACIAQADYLLRNEGSLTDLENHVIEILKKVEASHGK